MDYQLYGAVFIVIGSLISTFTIYATFFKNLKNNMLGGIPDRLKKIEEDQINIRKDLMEVKHCTEMTDVGINKDIFYIKQQVELTNQSIKEVKNMLKKEG